MTYKMIDNLYPLHQAAKLINNVQSKICKKNYVRINDPSVTNPLINVCIHGNDSFCNDARHQLLTAYNRVGHKTISLSEAEFMKIDEKFTDEMIRLSQRYEVEIIINNDKSSFNKQQQQVPQGSYYSIHIVGNQDNITLCETSLRIIVDTILNSYTIDCIDMQLSMIPVLGGVDLFNFHQVAKQTKANIYVPDLLPNLFNSNIISNNKDMSIWITAKNIGELLLAKFVINKLVEDQRQLITKRVIISKEKLDSIIMNNQRDLLKIMFKYGVFIQLPSLGELDNCTIIVQGCIRESVYDCTNDINGIVSNCYAMDVISTLNELGMSQIIQNQKTCVLTANQYGLQVTGRSDEFKYVLSQLIGNSMAIKLRLELGVQQREFISGKKNGKLIKILNQVQNVPKINFTSFNEYNFYIDIEATSNLQMISQTLNLMELEMPSEMKFNVPEVFHKSIIGNGGAIIQSIMKKYNVFIKFSSTNTSPNMYSLKRNNNVLIKCPRKNEKNMTLAKYEIDQLVYKCCMNFNTPQPNTITTIYHSIKFQLLKSHYLMLINNNKLGQVNKIESDYQSFINFPTSIEDFNSSNKLLIDMKGSESKVKHCAKQLKKILPNNYEFKVTFNPGKYEDIFITNRQDFENQIIIPFKILLGIEVMVNESPIYNENGSGNHHQFILSYFEENKDGLDKAIVSLTLFLRERGFLITEKREMEFNPLIEPVVSSSPVKLNQSLFNSANTSPLPLKPITNHLQKMSPNKLQYSPTKLPYSPVKQQQLYSPTKQQQQPYSPTKQQPYSPTKSQSYSPIKQPNFHKLVF
ncbi:KHD4 Ky domain-containing protein 4 [Candida maltosa Xu316]